MTLDLEGPALPPQWFDRDPVTVARDLLGRLLVRRTEAGVMAARVVEAEGYDCPRDPSCFVIARLPGATEALAGPPGRYYLHRAYEHSLLNVVCLGVGHPATILVRAAEPLAGLTLMREHRPGVKDAELANGPAKLCRALGIGLEFEGLPVDDSRLFFAAGEPVPDGAVAVTTRVGLRRGADLPWRFLVAGNPYVSKGKPP